jgi:PilZ domain-containing protein
VIWETLKQHRRSLRRPIGHIAVIRVEPSAPPHYCIVIDGSDSGVRISIPHDFEVPNEFVLHRYSGEEGDYKVVWRNGRLIGARLVGRRKMQLGLC